MRCGFFFFFAIPSSVQLAFSKNLENPFFELLDFKIFCDVWIMDYAQLLCGLLNQQIILFSFQILYPVKFIGVVVLVVLMVEFVVGHVVAVGAKIFLVAAYLVAVFR